ncbi:MAG: hypothetical protein JW832_09825 [Deltaproteobacteria bacterium]|nr:hypothetical protein [Deltaproteobacteria bacterium]
MKKKALVVLAACAAVFSVIPAFALTPGTCDDFLGTWAVTYTDNTSNTITDNITVTDTCSKATAEAPTPSCMPAGGIRDNWLCVAHGRRQSDNQTIQFRQISFDPIGDYAYYEATDEEINTGGQDEPYEKIPKTTFTKCAFAADNASYGLKSGVKNDCTDNATPPEDNCTLEKVIPSRISKLAALIQPIMPFVIIGSGDPAFVMGDRAAFDSNAIKPVIQLRIGKKVIIALSLVRPLKLTPGEIKVSIGDCFGTITVK